MSNAFEKNAVALSLRFPIMANNSEITHLHVRRPKVRDMIAMDKAQTSDAEKELTLFANLCEIEPQSLHELDMSDYAQLQTIYQSFLSSPQAMLDAPALP